MSLCWSSKGGIKTLKQALVLPEERNKGIVCYAGRYASRRETKTEPASHCCGKVGCSPRTVHTLLTYLPQLS